MQKLIDAMPYVLGFVICCIAISEINKGNKGNREYLLLGVCGVSMALIVHSAYLALFR